MWDVDSIESMTDVGVENDGSFVAFVMDCLLLGAVLKSHVSLLSI